MTFFKRLLIISTALMVLNGCSSLGGAEDEEAEAAVTTGAEAPGARKATGPRISKYKPGGGYGAGGSGRYGAGGRGAYGGDGAGGSGAYGAGGTGGAGGSRELDNASGPLARRVILFEYDSYEVQPQYQSVVRAHAGYLASHPEQNVVLEGHADERGSPEYNVALGEQRAKAVQRMMQLQGVTEAQIQVVSFGEEKPAELGHDEGSWQQNRRVEISYPGH